MSKSSRSSSSRVQPLQSKRTNEHRSLESVAEGKVLTGVPEVDTTQRQFPIPVKKSRTRGRSGKRKLRDRDDLLTTGPPSSYGSWRCLLMDKHQLEARVINHYRVQGKRDSPCYIYDEMHRYDNNTFYRNLMLGSSIGATIYFMTLIFVILPETNEKFDLFKDQNFSIRFIPIVLVAIFAVFVVRLCSVLYLSPYLITLLQVAILGFTVVGNIENECKRNFDRNLTAASTIEVPLTGAGQLPVFVMASIEDGAGIEPDMLRTALVLARCDQSLRKYCALNLLSELVNFILAIRLVLV